jgi:hypothetical protein
VPAPPTAPPAPGAVPVLSPGRPVAPPTVPRLFLVVSSDPFERAIELNRKITRAAKAVAPDTRARIDVTPVPRSVHDELAKLISRGPIASRPQAGEILVEPFAGDSLLWEITTGDPDTYITAIDLTFKGSDGQTATKHYDAAEKTRTEAALRYYRPGQYLLKLETSISPRTAELTLKKAGGQPRKVTITWPVSDRYFIVSLENFAGDARQLTGALMDKNVMGTPFKSVGPVEPMSLVLADLRAMISSVTKSWNGNTFEVQIPGLRDAKTTRVWVLFPLTREQKDRELAEINARIESGSSQDLSKAIRTRSMPARPGQAYVMRPDTEPKWYELTGGEDKPFRGDFTLAAIDQWKAKGRLPECYWLIVYEFGEGEEATPNPVQKERVIEGVRETFPVYAYDEEVPEWPTGIKSQVGSTP